MGQGHGELDLDPVLGGVEADGLVPPRLVLLPVGGEEQTRRLPAIAPLGLTQIGLVEVVMGSGEGLAPPDRSRADLARVGPLPRPAGLRAPGGAAAFGIARRACGNQRAVPAVPRRARPGAVGCD